MKISPSLNRTLCGIGIGLFVLSVVLVALCFSGCKPVQPKQPTIQERALQALTDATTGGCIKWALEGFGDSPGDYQTVYSATLPDGSRAKLTTANDGSHIYTIVFWKKEMGEWMKWEFIRGRTRIYDNASHMRRPSKWEFYLADNVLWPAVASLNVQTTEKEKSVQALEKISRKVETKDGIPLD